MLRIIITGISYGVSAYGDAEFMKRNPLEDSVATISDGDASNPSAAKNWGVIVVFAAHV